MAEQVRAYCNLCHVHCPIVCTVSGATVTRIEPDHDHPAGGAMCVKGKAAAELLRAPERLRYPLRRTRPKGDPDPGWERISWDEALDTIAERLLAVRAEYGAEAVAFCKGTSSGTALSDSEPWLARLSHAFGTPNVVGTTYLCNWHRDTGNVYTLGMPLPTPDFERAGAILLWGHNPGATSLAFARAIAAAQGRGARLVVVDPRRVGFAARADVHLQPRPGTDGALALALIHALVRQDGHDAAFVREWTNGPLLLRADTGRLLRWAELQAGAVADGYVAWDARAARPVRYDPGHGRYDAPTDALALDGAWHLRLASGEMVVARPVFAALLAEAAACAGRVEALTGVPFARVETAAALLAAHRPVALYFWNGLTQHTNTIQNSRAVTVCWALLGDLDRPGGNVVLPSVKLAPVEASELLPAAQAARRLGRAERPLGPPARPGQVTGYDLYRAILDGEPYPVKALVGFGGNLLYAHAAPQLGREALTRLSFFAQAELFLTPTASFADIVLPAASFLERDNVWAGWPLPLAARGHVQYRPAVVPPLGEARADTWIIFELAKRLGLGDQFWDGDLAAAYAHQLAPTGLTLEALKAAPGGVTLPLPSARYAKYAEPDPTTGQPRGFATPTRKVELYAVPFAEHGQPPLPTYRPPARVERAGAADAYPLVWTSAKLLQYCHSQHRALPSLRRAVPEPFAELHPQTAAEYGIEDGAWMVVESPRGAVRVRARVTEAVLPGVVCGVHGWWQACPPLDLPGYAPFGATSANANLLVPHDERDPISGTTPSRSYRCRIRPAAGAGTETADRGQSERTAAVR
ncbi:MAG TPA: molybdopterin-dependent oxidoreductase [Chloroflexota bacterium]|nr:molybdopterin-dependent oxidoreductase [Chloroflexota bacterium]